MKIHLLHTNDIHSRIENFMRLGHRLRRLRSEIQAQGESVLTFDIGDILDRVRPETEATLGLINADLLASLGYDGFVFGNNEGLTMPVRLWNEFVRRSNTFVFGTNVRDLKGNSLPFFHDFQVYHQGNVRVGVFGLTPDYEKPYELLGVRVQNAFQRALETVQLLRTLGCQLVVLLSHLGHHEDKRLAEQVPGVDVILGGHTHQFMREVEWIGPTAMFQSGKHALTFGHTLVELDDHDGRVQNVVSQAIEVGHREPYDQKMFRVYQAQNENVHQRLTSPVIDIDQPLEVSFEWESAFANALVDVLFEAYPADVGLMMAGALNASLLPGRVELQHIHGACSTPTRPLLLTLTGQQIQSIVEKSIRPEFFLRPGFGYGFRGSVVGYLALANATAFVKMKEPNAHSSGVSMSLVHLCIGNETVEPQREYRVVTCEFLWLSPIFEEFHQGKNIEFKPPLVREVLLSNLAGVNRIERAKKPRYLTTEAPSE